MTQRNVSARSQRESGPTKRASTDGKTASMHSGTGNVSSLLTVTAENAPISRVQEQRTVKNTGAVRSSAGYADSVRSESRESSRKADASLIISQEKNRGPWTGTYIHQILSIELRR